MRVDGRQIERVVANGKIATMRAPGHFVEALAIAGGRVVARGSTREMRELAPSAELVDCGGRTVIPRVHRQPLPS